MSASNLPHRRWSSTLSNPLLLLLNPLGSMIDISEERNIQLLLNIFNKTHWTNTQNTNKKMPIHFFIQFAVQQRRQDVRLHGALMNTPPWSERLRGGFTCCEGAFSHWLGPFFFSFFFYKAFEAIFISMYIHCQHVFIIRLKPFALLDITFILLSIWLISSAFWRHDHVPTLGEKAFLSFFNI